MSGTVNTSPQVQPGAARPADVPAQVRPAAVAAPDASAVPAPDAAAVPALSEPDTALSEPDAALAELTGSSEDWLRRYGSSLMGVFGTPQRVLVRGSGCTVWDADGKEYLDLLGGIAVNALGHAHPFLTSVISSQLATLGHVSNFFTSPAQVALAEKLLQLVGAPEGSKVFFANSGTEANEAAFKLARRNTGTSVSASGTSASGTSASGMNASGTAAPEPSASGGSARRTRIIALEGAFHGRTLGALALTAKKAYREPFEPLPAGVEHLPFGDIEALRAAVDDTVAAVFIEPIQGEAGVRPLPSGYLREARDITAAAGALLIVDEVQTGIGRTGKWFASEGVLPDAMTLAKGLGGGFPVGALITFGQATSSLLSAGQHGTTFGGNPVATAASLATLHVIETTGLLGQVQDTGAYLRAALAAVPGVAEARGEGLLIGFDLDREIAPAAVAAALEAGFIINATGPRTLRLAPPLILTRGQADTFINALPAILTAAEPAAEPARATGTTEGQS